MKPIRFVLLALLASVFACKKTTSACSAPGRSHVVAVSPTKKDPAQQQPASRPAPPAHLFM